MASDEFNRRACALDLIQELKRPEPDHEAICELIADADLSAHTRTGLTPLMAASMAGLADAVRDMLARGADAHDQMEGGNSSLHLAIRYGHAEVIPLLVEAGADMRLENGMGQNAFGYATAWEQPAIYDLLEKLQGERRICVQEPLPLMKAIKFKP
jgi:ankyrin repeat protein